MEEGGGGWRREGREGREGELYCNLYIHVHAFQRETLNKHLIGEGAT